MSELVRKPKFFRRAHNVFANKVLLDLENMKRVKHSRRQQIWETGKADYGFEGIEDSFITQTDGDAGLGTASMYQQAGFNSVGVIQTGTEDVDNKKLYGFHEAGPVTSTEAEEEYGDDGFDNFQYADDFNPEIVDIVYPEDFDMEPAQSDVGVPVSIAMNEDDDAGRMRPGTSAAQQRVETASGAHRTASSSASVRFSSTPIPPPGVMAETTGTRPGTSAGASAPRGQTETQQQRKAIELYEQMRSEESSSPSMALPSRPTTTSLTAASSSSRTTSSRKKKKKKGQLPPARKRRAYNRSTFFELLLDTIEVPDPHAPRFGMLRTSPSRQGSRVRSRSPIARAASQGTVALATDPGAGYLPSNKPHTATAGLSTAFSSLSVAATNTITQTATGTSTAGGTAEYTGSSSNQEDEALEEDPIDGDPYDKWETRSIKRAMTGDKREKAKDYR
jgi:hypothetical protein